MANENLAVIYRNTSYYAIHSALEASGLDCTYVQAIASHEASSATLYEFGCPNVGLMDLIGKLDSYAKILGKRHRVVLNKFKMYYDGKSQQWVVQSGIRLKARY